MRLKVLGPHGGELPGCKSTCFLVDGRLALDAGSLTSTLELDELAKAHSGTAMFEARDAEVFPAQHSREQFERFFVPGFTVLLFLLQVGGAYVFWRWLSMSTTVIPFTQPMVASSVPCGVFARPRPTPVMLSMGVG